ncbi:MAG: hypothetical protein FWG31_08650 [Oscillospiraceae bacterium]|nr:hypothetical protein [Oscillospiraceae bacterium]
MMMYCQHCGRALAGQTDYCPHCRKPQDKPAPEPAEGAEKRTMSGQGFKYWLKNVFWYHYRLRTFAILFAVFVIALTVYSTATAEKNDFIFILMSEKPVAEEQAAELAEFWIESIDGVTKLSYHALYLHDSSEYAMNGWQLLQIALISDEHSVFIVGESLTWVFGENNNNILFYTAEELGLPSGGPLPELIPLQGISMLDDLYLNWEPMYALVKRPYYNRDGSLKPETIERSELSIDCLRALLNA